MVVKDGRPKREVMCYTRPKVTILSIRSVNHSEIKMRVIVFLCVVLSASSSSSEKNAPESASSSYCHPSVSDRLDGSEGSCCVSTPRDFYSRSLKSEGDSSMAPRCLRSFLWIALILIVSIITSPVASNAVEVILQTITADTLSNSSCNLYALADPSTQMTTNLGL
jgi:hypothetical protein